jgi:hypothetical protein
MQYKVDYKYIKKRKYIIIGFVIVSIALIVIDRLEIFLMTLFGFIFVLFPLSKILYGSWDPFGYRCSQCKKKINTIPFYLKDGDRIQLYCPQCDIMWDIKETYHDV